MSDAEDSGEHARESERDEEGTPAASDDAESPAPPQREVRPLLDEPEFQRFGRVIKIFIWPFFFSWALAYVGGARGIDWLHFTGLGGVLLCMVGLLVWLIS